MPPSAFQFSVGQLEFHSDLSIPSSHRLIQEMVDLRHTLTETLGVKPSGETIHVYLFQSQARFQRHASTLNHAVATRRAYFMQTDTTLSVFASWSDQVATDLRHELTHAYVHSVIPRLPLWLDEGLAEYFEVSPGQGGWHPGHGKWVDDHPLDDLNSLEALSDPAAMAQHHYASSWAWVHFLLHHSGDSRRLLHEHLSQWQQQSEASRLSLAVAQKGWTGEVVRRHVRENSTE